MYVKAIITIFILSGVVFVLHWQLGPIQLKCTYTSKAIAPIWNCIQSVCVWGGGEGVLIQHNSQPTFRNYLNYLKCQIDIYDTKGGLNLKMDPSI